MLFSIALMRRRNIFLISFDSSSHPNVTLNVLSVDYAHYIDSLLDGRLDLYVGGVNGLHPAKTDKIAVKVLNEYDMAIVMPESHPLAGRKSIDLRELRDESFINLETGTNLQDFISALFDEAGFKPKVSMICASSLRFLMAAEGHGILVTTKLGATRTEVKGIRWATLSYPARKRQVGLVWHKDRIITTAMQHFISFAQEYYKLK